MVTLGQLVITINKVSIDIENKQKHTLFNSKKNNLEEDNRDC